VLTAPLPEALKELDVDRVVVFGVSTGGDVAPNLILSHKRLVEGLVLVAPGGLVAVIGNRSWLAEQIPDWLLLPATRLAIRFVATALCAMVKNPAALPPEIISEFVRGTRQPRGGIAYGRTIRQRLVVMACAPTSRTACARLPFRRSSSMAKTTRLWILQARAGRHRA
jgi:pimeloyl-ACP methyl ester carboxylesterase